MDDDGSKTRRPMAAGQVLALDRRTLQAALDADPFPDVLVAWLLAAFQADDGGVATIDRGDLAAWAGQGSTQELRRRWAVAGMRAVDLGLLVSAQAKTRDFRVKGLISLRESGEKLAGRIHDSEKSKKTSTGTITQANDKDCTPPTPLHEKKNKATGTTTKKPKRPAHTPDHRPEEFERFWRTYPRHVKRVDAVKAWTQVRPTVDEVVAILAALAWQVRSFQWTKDEGRFVPYPSSYLRGQMWLDEPAGARTATATVQARKVDRAAKAVADPAALERISKAAAARRAAS